MVVLSDLNEYLKKLDPDNVLKDVSFHLDQKNQIGFNPGVPLDFFVATPYGSWENYDKSQPPSTNPLAGAIQQALEAAKLPPTIGEDNNKYVFFDFVTFGPFDAKFWREGIKSTLANVINNLPGDFIPVIRLLSGDQGIDVKNFAKDDSNISWKSHFTSMFWNDDGTALITNDNAKLWISYYNPDLAAITPPTTLPAWAPKFESDIKKIFESDPTFALAKTQLNEAFSTLHGYLLPIIQELDRRGLPAIGWNHAKIIAVNGTRMTTGVANLWDIYGNGATKCFDSHIKILGDATLQAHKYVDSLSSYLNEQPKSDDSSWTRSIKLHRPAPKSANEFVFEKIPLFGKQKPNPASPPYPGTESVLTVNNIGDSLPNGQRYPVLSILALRHALLHAVQMQTFQHPEKLTFGPITFPPEDVLNAVINCVSDVKIIPTMRDNGLSPASWASKASQHYAISQATNSVVLVQPSLVCSQIRNGQALADELQKRLKEEAGLAWDKFLVPYDLMAALIDGIVKIAANNPTDTSKGIDILLSTTTAKDEYNDPSSWPATLAMIIKLANARTRLASIHSTIETEIKARLRCRRIMGNDKKHLDYDNHNKLICVDRKLMYIGSDNIYPEFNEQHGVWIDSSAHVEEWYKLYFDRAWKEGEPAAG